MSNKPYNAIVFSVCSGILSFPFLFIENAVIFGPISMILFWISVYVFLFFKINFGLIKFLATNSLPLPNIHTMVIIYGSF